MKVQIHTTIEKDIDIPYYTVKGSDFFAILSDDDVLCVASVGNNVWLSRQDGERKLQQACEGREITAEEFFAQYEKVLPLVTLKNK